MPERDIEHPSLPHIHVFPDQHLLAVGVAVQIRDLVIRVPWARITYSTGTTQGFIYEEAAKMITSKALNMQETAAFMLDEYYPCTADEQHSAVRFLQNRVFSPFLLKPENVHPLHGDASDPVAEANAYDALVTNEGIDLALLGISPGCHIGFNQQGTPFDSRTHLEQLSPETVARDHQDRLLNSPPAALTQGIATVLGARTIFLVGSGVHEGKYIRELLSGVVSEECPASALRTVPDKVFVYVDESAAKIIEAG